MELLLDLWAFIKQRKKYWLLPLLLILLFLAIIIVFAGGTAVAPFIYAIF